MYLRRAVELDDGDGEAWTRLALAYRRLDDAPALGALEGSLRGAVRDGAPEADAVGPHLSWSPVAVENEEQPFAPPH